MGRGIVSDKTPEILALQNRRREVESVNNAAIMRQHAAAEELRQIDLKIQEVSNSSKATAKTKMAETVAKIASLISECEDLATEAGIDFSLENLGYMTEDEALNNGWSSSSC